MNQTPRHWSSFFLADGVLYRLSHLVTSLDQSFIRSLKVATCLNMFPYLRRPFSQVDSSSLNLLKEMSRVLA